MEFPPFTFPGIPDQRKLMSMSECVCVCMESERLRYLSFTYLPYSQRKETRSHKFQLTPTFCLYPSFFI